MLPLNRCSFLIFVAPLCSDASMCISDVSSVATLMDELALAAKHRSCTGVLASHPDSRDVHIHNLSILFHGAELLMDSTLELNVGRRYGLIGLNGCGMSIFSNLA